MHKKYFEKIEKIFNFKSNNEEVNRILSRGFCYSEFQSKKLLFVGINPSYLPDAKIESHHYCVEDALKEYKKYFGKFEELAKGTKYENDWTYIDLFFFRETEQKKIQNLLNNDIDFIVNQLRLTNEIINEINPEIIVVCNSSSSRFFGINKNNDENIWLGYNFTFDNEYCAEVITSLDNNSIIEDKNKIENLIGTPVLFSSILTYQDTHSKKRLNWIIKRVGENITNLKKKYA